MNTLLSICIPTYNRAEYLSTTLEGIVSQNGFEENVEVVISDNCSSDTTREVALDYASRFPTNIIYNRNETNLEDGNFSKALSLGHGEFLKLQNDTAPLRANALTRMLETIAIAKASEKTIPFFISGNMEGKSRVVCSNLDEFLENTQYLNTWIGAFGVWRAMLPEVLPILESTRKSRLTQSWALLTLVSNGWKVLVDPAMVFDSITPPKKGGYNVAEVFGYNYNGILRHFNERKVLSDNAYEKAKKEILPFVNRYYFDFKSEFSFNKKGYFKWMLPFYGRNLYFWRRLVPIAVRIMGRACKCHYKGRNWISK